MLAHISMHLCTSNRFTAGYSPCGHRNHPTPQTLCTVGTSTNLGQLRSTALNLLLANVEPDTGHPVCEQGEHSHEQGEHHGTVLGVAVKPGQKAQQT